MKLNTYQLNAVPFEIIATYSELLFFSVCELNLIQYSKSNISVFLIFSQIIFRNIKFNIQTHMKFDIICNSEVLTRI